MSDVTKKVEEVVEDVKEKVSEEAKKLTDKELNKVAGGMLHVTDWDAIKSGIQKK